MSDRSRLKESFTPKGRGIWGGGAIVYGGAYNVRTGYDSVSDTVGGGDNGPLNIVHWSVNGGVINGVQRNGTVWTNYIADICEIESNFLDIGVSGIPSTTEAATQGAARTNPSAPYVDIPVNILELSDIPDLIRSSGRGILKTIGNANLKYQFGIKPLAGDLAKLCFFKQELNKRVAIIKKLRSKGYRKTVTVFRGSNSMSDDATCNSNGVFIGSRRTGITTEHVKVHTRWIPDVSFDDWVDDSNMVFQAARAVLGLTFDSSTAWEALPWTWLIDWCGGVGAYFQATRNIIPAQLASVTVMRHTKTEYTLPSARRDDDGVTMSAINARRETKRRTLASIAPTASLPFLNGTQLGILASLAVTRR